MYEERMRELMQDEKFASLLMELETAEEVQTVLEEKGISLEIEDIRAIQNMILNSADGELADDDLESVAGGSLTIMSAIGIASVISASFGGAAALGDGVDRWTRRRW